MHYLHRVLVYIPDIEFTGNVSKDEIRKFAEKETDRFYERAFDWRETSSAGRWSDIFPVNVICASDNTELFLDEIRKARSNQKNTVNMFLNAMSDAVKNLRIGDLSDFEEINDTDGFSLMFISRIISGEYYANSYYFDSHQYTAKINKQTIDDIKAHPENWAMCFFDYHD